MESTSGSRIRQLIVSDDLRDRISQLRNERNKVRVQIKKETKRLIKARTARHAAFSRWSPVKSRALFEAEAARVKKLVLPKLLKPYRERLRKIDFEIRSLERIQREMLNVEPR